MQSIYKPGGADTRETWFSIATFCTFRPFSLFGSDFQLFKLSCSNSKFCFYPALACLNIQATSNISKIWLIPFVQRVRNLCLLSSLLTLNLEKELNIFNTWFTGYHSVDHHAQPDCYHQLVITCLVKSLLRQKRTDYDQESLWITPSYSALSSRKPTSSSAISSGSSPRGSWVSVILCGTSHIGSQYLLPY